MRRGGAGELESVGNMPPAAYNKRFLWETIAYITKKKLLYHLDEADKKVMEMSILLKRNNMSMTLIRCLKCCLPSVRGR